MSECTLENKFKYKYVDKYVSFPDPINESMERINNYTADIIKSAPMIRLKDVVLEKVDKLDDKLEESISAYKSTKSYLKDLSDSQLFQQVRHYLNNFKNADDNTRKSRLLTLYDEYSKERTKIDDTQVGDLDEKLKNNFTTEEIEDLDKIFARSGIFSFMQKGSEHLLDDIKTKDPLSLIGSITTDPTIIELGKQYGDYFITGKLVGKTQILNQSLSTFTDEKKLHIKQIATLQALSHVPNLQDIMKKLNKFPIIKSELLATAKSIETLSNELFRKTGDDNYMDMNLITDVYEHNYEKYPLTYEEFKKLDTKEWQVLREPTKNSLGIKYRKADIQKVEGLGTNTYYMHNHIVISEEMKNKFDMTPVSQMPMGNKSQTLYVLTLTTEEKEKLGLVKNPAHTLYRSFSRYKFMLDTQFIRDDLLKNNSYKVNVGNMSEIESMIKDDKHPWFLKLDDNTKFEDLPDKIKRKYKKVENKSNIGGFSDKVDLVRIDVEPWLMGFNKVRFDKKHKTMNNALRVLQKLVLMSKIGMIIQAPKKLLFDYTSNNLLLLTKGIPLGSIIKETTKASKGLKELQDLHGKLIQANINVWGYPEEKRYVKIRDNIKKQLENHKYNFAYFNGFQQSLSTDVILKDFDTITGLHNDVKNIIKKFVNKANSEELNAFGEIVKKFMKSGNGGIDGLMVKLANMGETGMLKQSLKDIADSMKKTRKDEDVAQYLSNLFYSPGSEVTKAGTAFMQWTDTVPRIILYQHLRNKGINDTEAVQQAMDTFIDYRPNMPKEIQFLSDTFISPFPAFAIKAQKVIWNLLKTKPVSSSMQLFADLTQSHLFGVDVNKLNIFGSNVFEKIYKDELISHPQMNISNADDFIYWLMK